MLKHLPRKAFNEAWKIITNFSKCHLRHMTGVKRNLIIAEKEFENS